MIDSEKDPEVLKVLLEISQALHRSVCLDDLLHYIVLKTKVLMDSEYVSIILHDPRTDELYFRSFDDLSEENSERLHEIRLPADAGIAGSVFKSGNPELVLDACSEPRHYKGVDDSTGYRTQSLIATPLLTNGKIIGVVEACNKIEGSFDQRDLDFLTMISNTVAMALENARIHEELETAYRELQSINAAKDNLIDTTTQENARLRREVEGRYSFESIKGNSPQIIELFRLCEKAINSDITVLIEGETGTGKELIARCLHNNGPRQKRSFVTQNCRGIPETLLASELFGYKRGAFTGAVRDKKGLFEIADGGTIFLDEVADMPAAMQVAVLRVLQEGEIRPLGGNEVKRVDVRVISATNRSLETDVKNGIFREDLYYRLNVFTVTLPALRERAGDVPILAHHFLTKFNKKAGKSIRGFDRPAVECLCAYPFPGNVRELENEIERAVTLAEEGRYIGVQHLSERVRSQSTQASCALELNGTLKETVERLEKTILSQMMETHGGNKAQVARELGLSRFGLTKKLKRYDM
jgi:Nif-specific regulatory protein